MAIYYFIPIYLIVLISVYSLIIIKSNLQINSPKIEEKRFDYNSLISKYEILETTKKLEEQKKLPHTSNIHLVGTSLGFKNYAVLKLDEKTYIVSKGQILKGLKIIDIGKDFIYILSNGKTEKITFKSKKEQTPSTTTENQPLNLPPLNQVLKNNIIQKSEIERLTSDPGVMFTQIRLVPVVENGQTKGFRFDWIQDGSLFQKIGIQTGDILIGINNQKISSGEDAFRILQMMRNESSLKVTIQRNGQFIDLNYFIN